MTDANKPLTAEELEELNLQCSAARMDMRMDVADNACADIGERIEDWPLGITVDVNLLERLIAAARSQPAPVDADALQEAVAEFICQETEWADRVSGACWPQSSTDDGYRGDGAYVRLQPPDVLARERENAGRILTFLAQRHALTAPIAQDQGALREATTHVCPYPVLQRAGRCCGATPCGVTWERPCDAQGGCIDRSTCGGCEEPVFPKSAAPEEDQ